MMILHYLRTLYSLDTLDVRFTSSAKNPPSNTQLRIDSVKPSPNEVGDNGTGGNGIRQGKGANEVSPSRWGTLEYYVYITVVLVAVFSMVKTAYNISQESHPNYSKYAHLLSPGWIPGRKVDNSDAQYSGFRENIPYMLFLLVLHPLLRRLFDFVYQIRRPSLITGSRAKPHGNGSSGPQHIQADIRLDQRITFDLYFTVLFLLALHGISAFKVLFILYINFTLVTQLPKAYVPTATWVFNIGILFANELGKGYPLADVANLVLPWSAAPKAAAEKNLIQNWGSVLDSYGGLIPRWEILFNFTVLRLISFNLDYYWSFDHLDGSHIEKKQLDLPSLSDRDRISTPAQPADYSLRNYLAYILYAPLYLTGPILTFNDYISQLRHPSASITPQRIFLYGLRFLIALLTMEILLHYIYVVAISKAQPPAWETYTPFQLSMIGYFNLHHIWLKLLLPWRFFRLWALLDGVDAPENMVRCMSDNYSALAFWRGWHRSFNRWIVRYIYIPLGGSGSGGYWVTTARAVRNMLIVFTFVALWHDIQLKLLVWGWLVTLFVLPEVVAGYLFPKRKWETRPTLYRLICGVGGVGNVVMMIAANLVGFVVGLDGLRGLVEGIVGSWSGTVFMTLCSIALFTAVQLMFEIREGELRKGVNLKC